LLVQPGDKVRLKAGPHAGERGIVASTDGEKLLIRLDLSAETVRVLPESVTNFSLAARKAWVTEPNRGVGRRKGTKLCDRVSVTLRIDRDLWEQFRQLEEAGLIEDRTAAINSWLREKVSKLATEER
jgi:uncharacterized protein (DUF4415 family)